MRKFLLFVITIALFSACKKDAADGVFVRIENNSQTSFSDIHVGNSAFGKVNAGTTTSFELIKEPLYAAMCTAITSESTFNIGYGVCGTPMPPAFTNGKYTFVIKPSTSYTGYDLELKTN